MVTPSSPTLATASAGIRKCFSPIPRKPPAPTSNKRTLRSCSSNVEVPHAAYLVTSALVYLQPANVLLGVFQTKIRVAELNELHALVDAFGHADRLLSSWLACLLDSDRTNLQEDVKPALKTDNTPLPGS